MPLLNANPEMTQHKALGGFGYSAVGLNTLGATEFTLATLIFDESGSTSPFAADMNKCASTIVDFLRKSPRANNLLLRVVCFGSHVREFHGFKPLPSCNPADYADLYQPGGETALYDACVDGIGSIAAQGKIMSAPGKDFSVNGIAVIVSDGDHNRSNGNLTVQDVRNALKDCVTGEKLESMQSILVGVNMQDSSMKSRLDQFAKDAGIAQCEALENATATSLAKLAKFVSDSISSQSQALGTGGPSKPITF